MKITIHAISSTGGNYPVEFSDDGQTLRVFCHCQAGQLQQMCKHKTGLLSGDQNLLSDLAEADLLSQVLSSPAYPVLKKRLDEYMKALADIEREMGKLKGREKQIKADFAYELTFGRTRIEPTASARKPIS